MAVSILEAFDGNYVTHLDVRNGWKEVKRPLRVLPLGFYTANLSGFFIGPFETVEDVLAYKSDAPDWDPDSEKIVEISNPHEIDPETGDPWPIEPGCCSYHEGV